MQYPASSASIRHASTMRTSRIVRSPHLIAGGEVNGFTTPLVPARMVCSIFAASVTSGCPRRPLGRSLPERPAPGPATARAMSRRPGRAFRAPATTASVCVLRIAPAGVCTHHLSAPRRQGIPSSGNRQPLTPGPARRSGSELRRHCAFANSHPHTRRSRAWPYVHRHVPAVDPKIVGVGGRDCCANNPGCRVVSASCRASGRR